MKIGFPVGISSLFWLFVGMMRFISEWHQKKKNRQENTYKTSDIAVVLPAHNEELVITNCIKALKKIFKSDQIYVVSDGSDDKTYMLAYLQGCRVIGFHPGVGKAKAIVSLIKRFDLYNKYEFIFIVDADTQIDKHFAKRALPLFNDPEISVVFGTPRIHWQQHFMPNLRYYFIGYRERLDILLRFFYIYGQTWKYANVMYVIPGFATIYRSKILKQLRIDAPGLLVEDFNLAFQLMKKRLGKAGWDRSIIGWDQHPDNLKDYWKQVRRWNISFFQTVKKNGVWPSFFWLTLGVFTYEVFLSSMYILFLPVLLLFLLSPWFVGISPVTDRFIDFYIAFGPFQRVSLLDIFIGVFWFDYAVSVVVAIVAKKPQLIFYGLFFFFMHYLTSLILFSSLIPGFFTKSKGQWVSPKRFLPQFA